MGHVGSISLWVLVWKAHLVNTWFLAGPSRCLTCDFSPPKKSWAHMGPYVLVLVGSGWEGPSGIHIVFVWAMWTLYNPDKTQMGPRYVIKTSSNLNINQPKLNKGIQYSLCLFYLKTTIIITNFLYYTIFIEGFYGGTYFNAKLKIIILTVRVPDYIEGRRWCLIGNLRPQLKENKLYFVMM